jgi:hypothetical protein
MIESVWLRWPIMANHQSPKPSVTACASEDGRRGDAGAEAARSARATIGGGGGQHHGERRDDEAVEHRTAS